MKARLGIFFVFVAIFAIGLSGCNVVLTGGSMVSGSGVIKSEIRTVSGFSQIQASGGAEVSVIPGDPQA